MLNFKPMKIFRIVFYTFLITVFFTSCAKEYSSEVMAPPTGLWQFSSGSSNYSGYVTDFHTNNGSTNQYSFAGKTQDGRQNFLLNLYGDSLATGTYTASQFEVTFSYTDGNGSQIYSANQQVGEFIVNVVSVDSTVVNLTFSGTAEDAGGNKVQITNGKLSIN
jgi:hypothetical protein